jgi:hypothetical protein
MWTWKVKEGELWQGEKLIGRGYSGAVGFKNDPEKEALRNKGPIPRGKWKIGGTIEKHPRLGPLCIRLFPDGHTALGRSDFMIHGDSLKAPGTASKGCIILPYAVRQTISGSPDRELLVA